jgi:hypothetical protein
MHFYVNTYNYYDKLWFLTGYNTKPEYNKLCSIYIIVYKGFINLKNYKDNSDKIKYKIYL